MPYYETDQALNVALDAATGAFKFEAVASTSTSNVQRVTSGGLAAGQTQRTFVGSTPTITTGATSVALGTVTSGKTLYITDVIITTDQTAPLDVQIQAAAVAIYRAAVSAGAGNSGDLVTAVKGTSLQAITLNIPTTTAVQNVTYTIVGFEE